MKYGWYLTFLIAKGKKRSYYNELVNWTHQIKDGDPEICWLSQALITELLHPGEYAVDLSLCLMIPGLKCAPSLAVNHC